MSDWLMNDDSEGGGYLGLDDPAMPDAAPAPPSAPASSSGNDWLGGDLADNTQQDDWLGTSTPQPRRETGDPSVMDSQGDWISGSGNSVVAVAPNTASPADTHNQFASNSLASSTSQDASIDPIAVTNYGEMSIAPPQLHQVAPMRRSTNNQTGATSELNNLVLDVEVQVEVGLGNAALTVEEFLEMGRGSIVELDTPIDASIDLRVRGKLIARGQLVSINGNYGMRIIEMVNEK